MTPPEGDFSYVFKKRKLKQWINKLTWCGEWEGSVTTESVKMGQTYTISGLEILDFFPCYVRINHWPICIQKYGSQFRSTLFPKSYSSPPFLREIAIYISVEGGNRKKLKNKKEWVWPRGGRRVLFLEITQSPMNFLFFCFCRRWISSLRRQFFEWLPHFKNAGPFFTILLQTALTLRNKAHIAKIRQGTVLLIRNCQSSFSAIFIFT